MSIVHRPSSIVHRPSSGGIHMPRIRVNVEQVRHLRAQLWQTAEQVRTLESRLLNFFNSMDWEAAQRTEVEGQIDQMRSATATLVDQTEHMAGFLATRM